MIVFERWAGGLLFLHLVAATVALASSLHLASRGLNRWRNVPRPRLERLHGQILALSYSFCWLCGAIIYPTFRVRVRAGVPGGYEGLDALHPWAVGLFEAKEHLATVGLVAVWALALLLHAQTEDSRRDPLIAGLAGGVFTILVFNTLVGWVLSHLKAVGW